MPNSLVTTSVAKKSNIAIMPEVAGMFHYVPPSKSNYSPDFWEITSFLSFGVIPPKFKALNTVV